MHKFDVWLILVFNGVVVKCQKQKHFLLEPMFYLTNCRFQTFQSSGAAYPCDVSVNGTSTKTMVQFFLKNIIIVMAYCCYYKYGYCYYCSPSKVMSIFFFLYIVIWSPAGQRHNVTMMIPSLHSAHVNKIRSGPLMWFQGVSFHSETSTCTQSHSYLWTFMVHFFFFFFNKSKLKLNWFCQ